MTTLKIVFISSLLLYGLYPCPLNGDQLTEHSLDLVDAAPPSKSRVTYMTGQVPTREPQDTPTGAPPEADTFSYKASRPLYGWKPVGEQKVTTHESCLVAIQTFGFVMKELTKRADLLVQKMHSKKQLTPGLIKRATKLFRDIKGYKKLTERTYNNILRNMINATSVPDYTADVNATCWLPVLSKDCSADGGVHFYNFNVKTVSEVSDKIGYTGVEHYRLRLPSIAVPVMWDVDCKMQLIMTPYRTAQPRRIVFTNVPNYEP